jgi:DNA-binding LacI/PurR family transcriptional regulator
LPIVEVFGGFLSEIPKVNVDLYEMARMAVDELVSAGHQTIALVTHDQYTVTGDSAMGLHCDARDQYDGYKQAITDVGSNPIVITQPLQTNGADAECFTRIGHDSIDEILSLSPHPTAVICYNDDIAWGVCEACRERGIDVPRELAVVGYGDDKSAHLASPPLTTFSRPVVDVAESATELLLSRIERKDAEDRILVPELILRRSTLSRNNE